MNIVFFGSDNFAVKSLEALRASGDNVLCVVTQPDKKGGRGMSVSATPVAISARVLGIEVYQPPDVNAQAALDFLQNLQADLFVVAAYGQILSSRVLAIPGELCINAHASLLPKYRGASPVRRAIIDGEPISGVTIIKMTPQLDAGPMILKRTIEIEAQDTGISLEEKLSELAAALLLEAVDAIKNKKYTLTPQDETKATSAPKLKKTDGRIFWDAPAHKLNDLIRGCLGWPGAFTYYKGKVLKILRARFENKRSPQAEPGEILEVGKEGIVVACGSGALAIEELQLEAKKRMSAADFIAGSRISVGEILGR